VRGIRLASTAEPFEPGQWFQLGIAERDTNTLIGDVGVRVAPGEKRAEVGFTLRPQSRCRGLGGEAVSELLALLFDGVGLCEVIAITDARNLPAVRLLERVGMQRLDTTSSVFRGERCLEYLFAISRHEADPPSPARAARQSAERRRR